MAFIDELNELFDATTDDEPPSPAAAARNVSHETVPLPQIWGPGRCVGERSEDRASRWPARALAPPRS